MNMIECLGLDFLTEDEETFGNFVGAVCAEGKGILGYYGYPYLNREYGWAQFIARTELNEEEKHLEFTGLDVHLSGVTVWDALLSDINFQPKDADSLSRRVIVKRASDGGGMAVVNLVNADVLPSFLENDRIKMQMVAFPEEIHFYADEDAYAADQPDAPNGKKWLLADGSVLASGIFKNHAPDNPDNDKDHYSDNYMLIRGTVKKIAPGVVKFGEEAFSPFVTTVIHTEHGDLEIAHTIDQVVEAERENMREGATVWGVFILSGDVAINQYSKGIVRDEDHNLALLRYTLQKGDPKRMCSVLRENSVYVSEASGAEFVGTDEIIERLQFVRASNPDRDYFAHLATITSIDDGNEALPYGIGQRCVVLAEDEEDNYVSIAFLDLDEDGFITKMTISVSSRYHFKVDEVVRPKSILDDFKIPNSVAEPILARARFHGFLDDDITDEMVLGCLNNIKTYENNVQQLLEGLDDYSDMDIDERYANIFGYLFAKSIESDYSWRHGDREQFRLVVQYSPGDAVVGEFYTHLNLEVEGKVKIAYDYGKQFYKDLKVFCAIHEDKDFNEELLNALIIVQQIGEVYSQTILEGFLEKK
jgi:hypothetical protein